jgi:hypothetical protein
LCGFTRGTCVALDTSTATSDLEPTRTSYTKITAPCACVRHEADVPARPKYVLLQARRVRDGPTGAERTCFVSLHTPSDMEIATRGRALPHGLGRRSTAPTPRQVDGTAFEKAWSLGSNPLARDPRAVRLVDATEHARRAVQPNQCCVVAQRGRAPPHVAGRGSTKPTPRQVVGTGFRST